MEKKNVFIVSAFVIGLFSGAVVMNKVSVKKEHTMMGKSVVDAKKEKKVKYWQSPMDPSYIRNEPGKSPMGMDLVPVYEGEEDTGEGGIKINPVVVQNMGVRTSKVRKGKLEKVISTVGHLDYDERNVGYVTTKMSGWIEKLYVNYTGQEVKKGDPLFEIYSPELVSAQEEYLLSLKGRSTTGNGKRLQSLYKSARQRLIYWDISERQIKNLKKNRVVKKTLTIYSPFNGVVVHKNVTEGQYQKAGTSLYKIADLSSMWTYVHIYEYELPWIKVGQEAEMKLSYIPGKVFSGRLTYIYPYVNKKTRDIKVRLEFDNPDFELKPDMYTNVRIKSTISEETNMIPGEAIIDTGSKQIAFVSKGEGRFEPRTLTVGMEGEDGVFQILDGLNENEKVVTSGQFLIDSESKLQEAISKMLALNTVKDEESDKMDQSGHDMKGMKHEGHKMNHSDHDMKGMKHGGDKMDHSSHDMKGMKHEGHKMDHSDHDMKKMKHDGDKMDHSGHDMKGMKHDGDKMDHSGHDMKKMKHDGHKMDHSEHKKNHGNLIIVNIKPNMISAA